MAVKRPVIIIIIALLFAAVLLPAANTAYADGDMYEIEVDCKHATYDIDAFYHEAGEVVTFAVGSVDEGYALDHILLSAGSEIIPAERNNNAITFVMPDKNVKITVTFTDGSKKGLNTKEIIAISVTAAVVAVAVGYFIFVKVIKKKKAE